MEIFSRGALLAFVACSSFGSNNSPADAGAPDGSAQPTGTLYVSVIGSDANTGTTQSSPLQSLAAAFSLLEAKSLSNYEIRVCAGNYPIRNLASARVQAIRGAFNCQTWTRSAEFGKARGNLSDGANVTLLQGTALESNTQPSLTLSGTGTHEIEGIEATRQVGGAATVYVESNLDLQASHLVGASVGGDLVNGVSLALQVVNANVRIAKSVVEGKEGEALPGLIRGSQGAILEATGGTIEDSFIRAGGSVGTYACVALQASGGGRALTLNNVDLECLDSELKRDPSQSLDNASVVIQSGGHAPLRMVGSRVKMGTFKSQPMEHVNIVAIASSEEDLEIENSRIDSGELSTPTTKSVSCHGLITYAGAANKVSITNSVFLASCIMRGGAYPLWLRGGKNVLRHVTTGDPSRLTQALIADTGAKVDAANSVFLSAGDAPLLVDLCSMAQFGGKNNLLYAPTDAIVSSGTPTCPGSTLTFPSVSEKSVFAANGFETLFGVQATNARGAALGPGIVPKTCAIAQGGIPLNPAVATDIAGKVRGPTPSMGAWEAPNCAP